MSFREKIAWITLVSVLVCLGAYFGAAMAGVFSLRGWAALHFGLITMMAVVALQLVLGAAAALMNPKDARTPRDEREKLIQARSHTVGYYVLMLTIVGLIVPLHFEDPSLPDMMTFAVLGLVAAAAAVSVAQIIQYRRGG
jgi:hypothetical protein